MSSDLCAEQHREWKLLYERIRELLQRYGEEDVSGARKDFLLVDDNVYLYRHRIETSNPELLRPVVVKGLQELLVGFPNWEIVLAASEYGGVTICDDEIVDGLRRQNLPKEFQNIEYEGSRPYGSRFGEFLDGDPIPS